MRTLAVFVASLLLALAVSSVVVPSPALAQATSAEAESHFKRGVELYQELDFAAALVEFKRAYELSRNWRLLYNVAQAEYQLHDYAAALGDFETFLRDGGDKVPRARRAEVDKEIARLRARIGQLTVRASVADAVVSIDDVSVGPAPVTRSVAVGSRRVVVKKDGYVAWTQAVEVASGDTRVVEAVLEPVAVVSTAPPPSSPEPATTKRFPWELWAVTGALTASAITTGVLAVDASSKLDTTKNRLDATDAELHDAAQRVKTFGLVADVLAIGAIGTGVVALYFTLKSPARAETTAAGARVRLSPWPGGLTASGRF